MALAFVQGRPIYAVRNSQNHYDFNRRIIPNNIAHNNTISIGIYHDYGEAVDNGYLTLAPYNAQTFANARNNLNQNEWIAQVRLAQAYMRRSRQPQGVSRAITVFTERNSLNTLKGRIGSFILIIICFIFAISGNYLLFRLTNIVYRRSKCNKWENNCLPQCMWSNKMKYHLAEHSHSLGNIIINKLFTLLKALTG